MLLDHHGGKKENTKAVSAPKVKTEQTRTTRAPACRRILFSLRCRLPGSPQALLLLVRGRRERRRGTERVGVVVKPSRDIRCGVVGRGGGGGGRG